MKTALLMTSKSVPFHERESFWKHHIEAFQASKLKRSAYCRNNGVDVHQFCYWLKKHEKQMKHIKSAPTPLVPVKLKSPEEPRFPEALCTLTFRSGAQLKIHAVDALSVILERMS